ncbi:50S ribosomal protein L4 [Ethanoligenens harbinense]|uniref:Large ribosomal subunit protein uL4 n=1 Tax=Ethanoligenens harbinense (strain DSM 18485 / JCM 12961 / CGMCC 1.5033 / YUAN-3) TaxID=663278 RepID=E6U821_ETHHY|nr:50S ribosomal protein L4 [Ethanoligenens harbinense]ADU25953.1 ribosomal protein L4/L1e [Ethanoligenens harbinense YUAN-3]AVQ95104.1 50S ribosomal protein L4 [Ethanoligenens harbinense YUAN-3]AYF37795.1 50S ribosomal protein L4 [Ethanoligenens harbinense]AYF40517.1 50S ribosomal protein L4 [Ethanoligenens harbinense]QCN91350.1 50S ribosomal protein L4 [Ethanoligenens harbinense]
MPKATVFNIAGEQVGEIELADSVFGIEPNKTALHTVVVNYLANQRQGTQSTLTRSEVSGGGRKPWRQKGTGHARQGSTRAPQWKHGGIALGPKPRSYTYTVNKKVRRLALKSALSAKLAAGELVVLDAISLPEIKTKQVVTILSKFETSKKALFVTAGVNENLVKSARNIPGVKTASTGSLNVYDLLDSNKFFISKDAVAALEEVYA